MSLRATRQYVDVLGAGDGKLRVTRQLVDVLGKGEGKCRVTRQLIDVLGKGGGKCRVSRQYVDVLGSAIEGANYEQSVTSTLSFTQTVTGGMAHYVDVVTTLEFVDEAVGKPVLGVTTTMELTDPAVGVRDIPRQVTDTLQLTQELVWAGPHYFNIMHFLPLEQVPYGHLAVINVWVNDTLGFTLRTGRTLYASVTDHLNLSIVGIKTNNVKHTLTFSQTILGGKSRAVVSHLDLAQTYHVQGTFHRAVTDDLGLVHSGAYERLVGGCQTKQYQPQLGFTTDTSVDIPPADAPVLSDALLTLSYPFVSPTVTVVLRNPEFNNKDSLNFNRINRTTRGGTLVVYADPSWPKTQKLNVELRSLGSLQADTLLDFFDQSLGKEIRLLDHEGRQWRGIITNPDSPVANPGRGDYSASFEFEGEPC